MWSAVARIRLISQMQGHIKRVIADHSSFILVFHKTVLGSLKLPFDKLDISPFSKGIFYLESPCCCGNSVKLLCQGQNWLWKFHGSKLKLDCILGKNMNFYSESKCPMKQSKRENFDCLS